MNSPPSFTRVVLGISHSPINPSALRLAADFADMLDIGLLGLFVKDAAMLASAGLPFVREFKTFGGKWSQVDPARLIEEADLAARHMRRQLSAAVRIPQGRLTFETFEGDPAHAFAGAVRKGDIVVIPEPQRFQSLVAETIETQVEAAFLACASVLLVPDAPAPQRGPVAAIVRQSHESGIAAAATIAAAVKTDLVVIDIGDEQILASTIAELAGPKRISVRVVRASQSCLEAGAMPVSDLNWPKERLLVTARGVMEDSAAARAAFKRTVPVLITNVDQTL